MAKTVLITGCAGFVGTNLAMHLLSNGYHVIGLDKGDFNHRLHMSSLLENAHFTFIQVNLATQALPSNLKADVIFHLAALPHVDYSKFYPEQVIQNNIASTVAVAGFAARTHTPMIFSSSVEVYGGATDKIYNESDAPRPLSPYAASKVGCEAIIQSYVETQNLRATIFRFTNLYGPWQLPDRLIPRIIAQSLLGDGITIEKGTNRDFLYIADACELLELAINSPHNGELYNLATGSGHDNFHAVEEILRHIPNKDIAVHKPRQRDGRGKFLIASPHSLHTVSSWRPQTALAVGIAKTCQWYKERQSWWDTYTDQLRADRTNDRFLIDTLHWQ